MKTAKILKMAVVVAVGMAMVFSITQAWAAVEFPSELDAGNHPKFINEMPLPARINATSGGKFTVEMSDTVQFLGIYDTAASPATDNPLNTRVWGYGLQGGTVTYPGATFVAMRDVPVEVKWQNKLPKGLHLVALDDSIHLFDPIKKTYAEGNIPVVAHLHGGHTESASDGLPEAWFTQGWAEVGPQWVKKTYYYDNDQEAATLWYHDHTLGITRLNVYAGLAGFYLLRDANENTLINDNILPGGAQELEVVIQDRVFDANGQLKLPVALGPEETNFPGSLVPSIPDLAGEPFLGFDFENDTSIVAEFFGDFILVNGVAWPFRNVEPRKYRLRLLNGSDSRFYVLEFRNTQTGNGAPIPFLQVGTDDGLLEYPVQISQLILAPGERADVVFDFDSGDITGSEVFLRNFGPDEPFKTLADIASNPAEPDSTQQVMKFVVGAETTGPTATVTTATALRPSITPLIQTGPTRMLGLFEGLDEFGRLQPLLGVAETTLDLAGNRVDGSLGWFNPITEWPSLGAVEVWEIYNSTEDAHPIHLHLVTFQIINREPFETDVIDALQVQHGGTIGVGKILENIQVLGGAQGPALNEDGWKDTVIAPPGYVTRVIAKFDRPGRYVWHCHILSHEDHEMMRPFQVVVGPTE